MTKPKKAKNPQKAGRPKMNFNDKMRSVMLCVKPRFIESCGDKIKPEMKQKDYAKTLEKIYSFIEQEINEIP